MSRYRISEGHRRIRDLYLPQMLAGTISPLQVAKETGVSWHCSRMWLYRARRRDKRNVLRHALLACQNGNNVPRNGYRETITAATGKILSELEERARSFVTNIEQTPSETIRRAAEFRRAINELRLLARDLRNLNRKVAAKQVPKNTHKAAEKLKSRCTSVADNPPFPNRVRIQLSNPSSHPRQHRRPLQPKLTANEELVRIRQLFLHARGKS